MTQSPLEAWLARLELAHPRAIELGVDRVRAVAQRLGVDAPGVPVFTVGGTNGKGSCVAVLEALLAGSGHRTGVYTSPHLRRFNERVRVDGREAEDDTLCAAFEAVERARDGVSLSYFEHTTLAALLVFRDAGVDRIVLEVGLGGRLDAVNLVDPDVAVVTSIALDHQEWLGPDRESIGREKAGIFRAGRPAVIGDRAPPASLDSTARGLGAPVFAIGREFDEWTDAGGWHWRGCDAQGSPLERRALPAPRLLGANVACALQALALAGTLPPSELLRQQLPRVRVEGRQQQLRLDGIDCVLDVAHNPAGLALLRERLEAAPPAGRTAVVFAAMADKDVDGMLAELSGLAARWYLPRLPGARAAPPEALAARLGPGLAVQLAEGIAEALDAARSELGPDDRLVVCGSFHLVGPALEWFAARGGAQEDYA